MSAVYTRKIDYIFMIATFHGLKAFTFICKRAKLVFQIMLEVWRMLYVSVAIGSLFRWRLLLGFK